MGHFSHVRFLVAHGDAREEHVHLRFPHCQEVVSSTRDSFCKLNWRDRFAHEVRGPLHFIPAEPVVEILEVGQPQAEALAWRNKKVCELASVRQHREAQQLGQLGVAHLDFPIPEESKQSQNQVQLKGVARSAIYNQPQQVRRSLLHPFHARRRPGERRPTTAIHHRLSRDLASSSILSQHYHIVIPHLRHYTKPVAHVPRRLRNLERQPLGRQVEGPRRRHQLRKGFWEHRANWYSRGVSWCREIARLDGVGGRRCNRHTRICAH